MKLTRIFPMAQVTLLVPMLLAGCSKTAVPTAETSTPAVPAAVGDKNDGNTAITRENIDGALSKASLESRNGEDVHAPREDVQTPREDVQTPRESERVQVIP